MLYTIETKNRTRIAAIVEDNGKIHFYLPIREIPGDLLLRIEHEANAMRLNHAVQPMQIFSTASLLEVSKPASAL